MSVEAKEETSIQKDSNSFHISVAPISREIIRDAIANLSLMRGRFP